jgi:hypothetical protein
MLGCVYTFESVGNQTGGYVSMTATGIINAAIRGRSEIRFQELTAADDTRSLFAVFFESAEDKTFFEAMLEPLCEMSGLHIDVVRSLVNGKLERMPDDEPGDTVERCRAGSGL